MMRNTPRPRPRMLRVFVDTTVLFAAVYSSTGSARDLIRLATEEKVQLIVSQRVLIEMERNLQKKAPDQLPAYRLLLAAVVPEMADEPAELAQSIATYVVSKDAPIVAAAVHAQVDYLVTYDRKHLLDRPEVAQQSGLAIVTPDVVVQAVRAEQDTANPTSE